MREVNQMPMLTKEEVADFSKMNLKSVKGEKLEKSKNKIFMKKYIELIIKEIETESGNLIKKFPKGLKSTKSIEKMSKQIKDLERFNYWRDRLLTPTNWDLHRESPVSDVKFEDVLSASDVDVIRERDPRFKPDTSITHYIEKMKSMNMRPEREKTAIKKEIIFLESLCKFLNKIKEQGLTNRKPFQIISYNAFKRVSNIIYQYNYSGDDSYKDLKSDFKSFKKLIDTLIKSLENSLSKEIEYSNELKKINLKLDRASSYDIEDSAFFRYRAKKRES